MKFLVAPDKFKGSLSAQEVSENIALGIRDVIQNAEIEIAPMADGGEGTAEVICKTRGGKWVTCSVHGPLGDPIEASYVWLGESAVMEMSEAAGMRRLKNTARDVLRVKYIRRRRNVARCRKTRRARDHHRPGRQRHK